MENYTKAINIFSLTGKKISQVLEIGVFGRIGLVIQSLAGVYLKIGKNLISRIFFNFLSVFLDSGYFSW